MGHRAQLRLRAGLGAQVVWPAGVPAAVLVLLVDAHESAHGEYICRVLSETLGIVALSAPCERPEDGATAIEWTADHAAQLGADGGRLLVAGLHGAAATAAGLAVRARDDGWPDVSQQILIHPRFAGAGPARLDGVAPATVVGRHPYAAHLRRAEVHVDVLDLPDPFRERTPRAAVANRLLRDLARRLGETAPRFGASDPA